MVDSKEIWVLIQGWNSAYMASNFGRIKSLPRYIPCKNGGLRLTKEKILKQQIDNLGYCRVGLHYNHVFKLCVVHRLIAQCFIPNSGNKPCINHKDGNPSNNNIDNLEWCTYKENSIHSFKVLKRKVSGSAVGGIKWPEHKKGKNHHNYGKPRLNAPKGETHFGSKKVKCDTLDVEFYSIKNAADILGLTASQVSLVLAGKYRQTNGLSFRYIK